MTTITLDRLITHVLSVSDFDVTKHQSSNILIPEFCHKLGNVSTFETQTIYEKYNISLYYYILSICNDQFNSMSAFNRMNLIHMIVNNFYKETNNIDFLDYNYTPTVLTHIVEYFRINLIIFSEDNSVFTYLCQETNRMLLTYEYEDFYYPLGIDNNYNLLYSEYKELIESDFNDDEIEITNQFIESVIEEEEEKTMEPIYYTTKMKIAELQEIAESYNISILKENNKNKTKKDLIEEFKLYNSSI